MVKGKEKKVFAILRILEICVSDIPLQQFAFNGLAFDIRNPKLNFHGQTTVGGGGER